MAIILVGVAVLAVVATAVGLMLHGDKREASRIKNIGSADV